MWRLSQLICHDTDEHASQCAAVRVGKFCARSDKWWFTPFTVFACCH